MGRRTETYRRTYNTCSRTQSFAILEDVNCISALDGDLSERALGMAIAISKSWYDVDSNL